MTLGRLSREFYKLLQSSKIVSQILKYMLDVVDPDIVRLLIISKQYSWISVFTVKRMDQR